MEEAIRKQVQDRRKIIKASETFYDETNIEESHGIYKKKNIQGCCAVIFYLLLSLIIAYFILAPFFMLYAAKIYFYCNDIFVPWLIVGGSSHIITYALFLGNYLIRKQFVIDSENYSEMGIRRFLLLILTIIWYIVGICKILNELIDGGNNKLEGDICKTYLYRVTFCFTMCPFILFIPLFLVICYFIGKK